MKIFNKAVLKYWFTVKYPHVSFNWDTHFTVPTFDRVVSQIDFKFNFKMPPANKVRVILERDSKGRIVHSQPQQITTL